MQNLEQHLILVVNIGAFVFHFPLDQQVSDVPLLQKPLKKLTESFLHPNLTLVLGI